MMMYMKRLWIDDIRTPPDGWIWAKTSVDAIHALWYGGIYEVSFDHDLGGDDTTRPVVLALSDPANNLAWPSICRIHTANPIGREWLTGMIDRYGPGVTR